MSCTWCLNNYILDDWCSKLKMTNPRTLRMHTFTDVQRDVEYVSIWRCVEPTLCAPAKKAFALRKVAKSRET